MVGAVGIETHDKRAKPAEALDPQQPRYSRIHPVCLVLTYLCKVIDDDVTSRV
jgi:hypothetical protein